MLEITLLKTTHHGMGQVKKLLSYISKANVYSAEGAFLTEESAEALERRWERLLSSGNSQSKSIELVREKSEKLSKEVKDYESLEREYLLRNNVLLWLTERFSDRDSAKLKEGIEEEDVYRRAALTALSEGDVTGFLNYQWENFQVSKKLDETRDREIARNIDRAEEQLRERYPSLSWDKKMHFVVNIGAIHSPEKYTNKLANVYDISGNWHPYDRVYQAVLEGKQLEEVKTSMLAVEMLRIAKLARLPLKEKQIMSMNFEQLSAKFVKF
ncbi:MAG TPA: hypothetical protein VJA18_05125 [Candidatus Nanoarchaeia archaeon]|nr:hypothetical protein [Candidatus Nanoarchaeia archaeon]